MSKNKHLTAEERTTIETELTKSSSFKSIGATLGKDCTTIAKEVKKHRYSSQVGAFGHGFNDCLHAHDRSCQRFNVCSACYSPQKHRRCWSCGKCTKECPHYEKYSCEKLLKAPYVCNGCSEKKNHCSLEKWFYRADQAQTAYREKLSEARTGFDITEKELEHLDDVVSPLIKNGQSIHHVCMNHSGEIMLSERTMYTYIDNGLLSARNIDMPRVVKMHPRKNHKKYFKVDKACRIGRTFDEYQTYMNEHPDTLVVQCDSVEGVKGGKVLLTVHFVAQELQLAFLRDANDSQSVTDIFNRIYLELHPDRFLKLFPLLLCDNGSEFSNPKALEYDGQGNRRTTVFYCDPNAPFQKPNCENNHEMIRRIIPKGVDIGQYTQKDIDLMMSHINSYARAKLGDKCPYDVFSFLYGEDILKYFGLSKIPPDEIILSPKLLKK